ncbi:peptide/nickel transport system substrate-binding protein [Caloranaerobacter azorensis DSM 13643]|uniref:Peptide/nickel transport system substrate-binding protein n=1 Tax=Caloranaerobacter azorensis DSM 13643 TaxID=1121264 RepID=A0A1M5WEN7_9FIRM|nr:ABC transporter substrate-binding protein [Caloranaerobacter azorensis]SHH85887.1 peptide/nickel transport system substrate-binding protein [Caloranaerobacter azorensis DSM 13643]
MKYKRILVLFMVFILAVSLIGCGIDKQLDNIKGKHDKNDSSNQKKVYEPAFGGEIVVPISYIKTFNPLLSKDKSLYYFNKLIYESLFDFDEDLNLKKILVEDYKISQDGQTIYIKLKDNVRWHDGHKFTASDVKFTINVIKYGVNDVSYKDMLDAAFKAAKPTDIQHILNVKVVDDLNLQIHFDRSYSNALESLTFPIIPKHQFVEDGAKMSKKTYLKVLSKDIIPIGTGPYKFSKYDKLKKVELVRNDDWHLGKPYISKVIGKILSDNELAVVSFETGQLDLTRAEGVDWEKYAHNNKVSIYEYVTQKYEFLGFNFKNKLISGEKGLALRKAIAFGINRDNIINKVYLGHATKVDVPIHPNSWLLSQKNVYDYNVNKAKEILNEAGWKDTDNDGILEDEKGNKLKIRLLTNSYNPLRLKTANMIIEDLKTIGIEVIPQYDTRIDDFNAQTAEKQWNNMIGKIRKGDFDLVLLGWELSLLPDLSFAFHSTQIDDGSNFINYKNENMDQLLVRAFRATTRAEKKNIYGEIQKLIVEDLPYVSLFFRNNAILIDDKIKGEIKPIYSNIYNNIDKWFIPKELQEENKKVD